MGVASVIIYQRFQRFGRTTVQVVDTTMLQTHVEKPTEPPIPLKNTNVINVMNVAEVGQFYSPVTEK